MLGKLFSSIAVTLLAQTVIAQTIDIGRATVTFPSEGQWIEVFQNNIGTSYTGDISGTTTAESKTYLLLNSNKEWIAMVTLRASKSSVSNATINWTAGCKGIGTQAVYDFTKGSPTRIDCLKVLKSINANTYISHASLKPIKDLLDSKEINLNGPAYLVTHMIGTESGTFVSSSALISHKALKSTFGSKTGEEFAGQPGVAWGHLVAAESRSSAYSIRGKMTIPSFE